MSDPELSLALRPCPCGWNASRIELQRGQSNPQGGGWSGKVRLTCIGCTASTGYLATEAEAIAAWNRRTPDAIVPDPEDDVQCTIVAQAICKIRFTPNGDGCECASGGPYIQSCGCEKISGAVLTALRDAARGVGG